MKNILEFLDGFCNELKENNKLEKINFITKYPSILKPVPLTRTIVSVGINKINIGNGDIGETDEKNAVVQMEIIACVPFVSDSTKCFSVMQDILEYLCFESSYDVSNCSVGNIKVNKETGAYEICGIVDINTSILRAVI